MRALLPALFLAASVFCGADPIQVGVIERQFRSDMKGLVLSRSFSPPSEDELDRSVEALFQQVVRVFPEFFADDARTTAPTDESLSRLVDELKRVSAGSPSPVLVSFYRDLWQSDEGLNDSQRVIFGRLMRSVIDHVIRKEEAKAANQALQTTSVTRGVFGKVSVSERQRRGV